MKEENKQQNVKKKNTNEKNGLPPLLVTQKTYLQLKALGYEEQLFTTSAKIEEISTGVSE